LFEAFPSQRTYSVTSSLQHLARRITSCFMMRPFRAPSWRQPTSGT
jgi:hypothetical protein